jgi:hypothetical protein
MCACKHELQQKIMGYNLEPFIIVLCPPPSNNNTTNSHNQLPLQAEGVDCVAVPASFEFSLHPFGAGIL